MKIDTTEAEKLIAEYTAGIVISKDQDSIIAKIAAIVVANKDTFGFIDALKIAMRSAFCVGVVSTEQSAKASVLGLRLQAFESIAKYAAQANRDQYLDSAKVNRIISDLVAMAQNPNLGAKNDAG